MKGILEKIVQQKRVEVAQQKAKNPIQQLTNDNGLKRQPLSMQSAIINGSGIIAEFKRASPSKGVIRANADIIEITKSYQKAGASAISVLTDTQFFKASASDLPNAREVISIPILRKEFIIDPYQIYQAKIMGADCILLIAAILEATAMKQLLKVADDLGLDTIVEVHNLQELTKLSGNEKLIGVNNRNLDTFEVDIETSLGLSSQLGDVVKITESGLSSSSNLQMLLNAGYKGFLVGESFMKEENPGNACADFIKQIKSS